MGPQNIENTNPVLQQFLTSQNVAQINEGLYYRVCIDTYGYLVNQYEQTLGAGVSLESAGANASAEDFNYITEKATLLSQKSIFYATPFARLWSERILPLITEAAIQGGQESSTFGRRKVG
jgi:hypothetical protein